MKNIFTFKLFEGREVYSFWYILEQNTVQKKVIQPAEGGIVYRTIIQYKISYYSTSGIEMIDTVSQ